MQSFNQGSGVSNRHRLSRRNTFLVRRSLLLLFLANILIACGVTNRDESLANLQCGSCHLAPSPSLLDSATWAAHVLPEMKFRMGLDPTKLWTVPSSEITTVASAIPNTSITEEDWRRIERYYLENAPKSMAATTPAIDGPVELFNVSQPQTSLPPVVTLLRYDTTLQKLLAGTRTTRLYYFDQSFSITDSIVLMSPPADYIAINADSIHILQMGKMDPNDLCNGSLTAFVKSKNIKSVLIDSLKRPVHMIHGDFDRDGDKDILISCFGNFTGGLLLFENRNDRFIKHVVHYLPGTRRTLLRDVNGDGLLDIIALITQGNEQITLFINQGDFRFRSTTLLQFPPVYGSSYFDLVDMNNDGLEDILYCNGDNADFSAIVKPYHGIRLFINNGDYQFTENLFLPMSGAFQAIARDFDGDGDIDIAAIAYFPDFNSFPRQSFVHFENTGNTFIRRATPLLDNGRWIVMEAADLDNDNDDDIVLGALNFNIAAPDSVFSRWKQTPISLQFLENAQ